MAIRSRDLFGGGITEVCSAYFDKFRNLPIFDASDKNINPLLWHPQICPPKLTPLQPRLPFIIFSRRCLQLQVGPYSSMKPDQPSSKPNAMSEHHPKIDLLREHLLHRCEFCLTPLHKFTKIIAGRSDREMSVARQGFHVVCVSCFAGWCPEPVGVEQVQECCYKYYVCRGMGRATKELAGWSANEIIHLQGCIEKYGPEITSQTRQQFVKSTGSQKSIAQLLFKARQINSAFSKAKQGKLGLLKPRRHWQPQQSSASDQPFSAKGLFSRLGLHNQDQQKQGQQFLNLINYRHPLDYLHKYPDNQADFMSRATATNKLTQQRVGFELANRTPGGDPGLQDTVKLISCFLKQKTDKDRDICQFIESLSLQFATFKRSNKKLPTDQKQTTVKRLYQLAHPELSHLGSVRGGEDQLRKIIRFKQQRQQLLEEAKQRRRSRMNAEESAPRDNQPGQQQANQHDNNKQQGRLEHFFQQASEQP